MLKPRHTTDSRIEAGIDEAGRGCLWGPLLAAAVILPAEETWSLTDREQFAKIKDSKKLTPKRRAALEGFIKEKCTWSVGRVEAAEIDQLGMTRSNQAAFRRALGGLRTPATRAIIDGILSLPDLDVAVEQQVLPEADGTYLAVAAASILAKEGRDRWVLEQCAADKTLDERYGLSSSKGYGTAVHRAGVQKHGMHAEHRRLFLRRLLGIQMESSCLIEDEASIV